MKVIVGLGNPEASFQGTRHNAGFVVLDKIANKFVCDNFTNQPKVAAQICKKQDLLFAKPATYMNLSGQSIRAILDYYQAETKDLYVIHDDLDLELGQYKIQYGTGPQGHNGLLSVYQHLGTKNFWHVRVGVDTRDGSRLMEPSDYVLERFSTNEKAKFERAVNQLTQELFAHIQMKH